METSRQEYTALLAGLQPEQAINVLNDRVTLINSVNTSIADFLQERRKIEERYAADLRKLARRPQQDGATALGVFQMPWQRIVSGTENLAQSHETLASKIETDVETPLKQYSTKNREMQAITTIQGNLASIARDLVRAREKADKLNAKGSKKAGDASSNVDDASREWESQAPFVFEQLQALDENRVDHLRGVLTQFQTHEADQVERNRTSAESCLNALLNIETADEIKTYAARIQQGRFTTTRRPSSTVYDQRPSSSGVVPPAPPPPRNHDQRARGASTEDKLSSLPETPQKSKMGGLKRLGTVMSRRKSAAPPPPQAVSEKKKEKSRSFAPFRRGDSSRSFQDLEATGQDLTPVASQSDRTSLQQGSTSIDASTRADIPVESVHNSSVNGFQAPQKSPSDELPLPLLPTMIQQSPSAASDTQTLPSISAATLAPAGDESHMQNTVQAPQSGYELEDSSRNLKIRDQPIQEDAGEAQLAMSNMANQLRLQAQNSSVRRAQGSVRGRRDVRNTMFVPGNQEIPGMAPSPSGGLSPIASPIETASADPSTMVSNSTEPVPLTKRSGTSGTMLEDQATGSDVNSIHSVQSLTGLVHHPELHEPGLNASIVETVSTWFSEAGISKSSVVGEIAFAHITSPLSTLREQDTIRLQNFQVLEKVAVNPAFITAPKKTAFETEDEAGSYTIALSAIRRTIPTVGFKYQLHLDETNLAQYSPILVTPAWQIVEGQASAIVLYSLNPAFPLSSSTSSPEVTLKNVVISVNLDIKEAGSGKPTSAMMAPTQGASFRRKAGTVIWRFPELTVKPTQERLLVRFMIEGGTAKKSGIEFKFEMSGITAGSLGVERLGGGGGGGPSMPEADPFADEEERKSSEHPTTSEWETVPTKKMLVSGRYSAS